MVSSRLKAKISEVALLTGSGLIPGVRASDSACGTSPVMLAVQVLIWLSPEV